MSQQPPPSQQNSQSQPERIVRDPFTLRLKFFARVLACRSSPPRPTQLPLAFPSEGPYFRHMTEAIISEAYGVMDEAYQKVRFCLGSVRDLRRTGNPVDGIEEVYGTLSRASGSRDSWGQLSEGTILQLRSPQSAGPSHGRRAPVLAMLLGRPIDNVVKFCVPVRDSPGSGCDIHVTDAGVLVPLRAYTVCARQPDAGMVPELLPLPNAGTGSSEVEAICRQQRWKVKVRFPIGVRADHHEEAEPCGQVRPGEELEVVQVYAQWGRYQLDEDGTPLSASSPKAVQYWLGLPADSGWLYASKEIDGRKSVLVEPVGAAGAWRTKRVETRNDLEQVPDAKLSPTLSSLNRSQREAVTDFLKTRRRLTLLQGPPGSGKSETILVLLEAIVKCGLLHRGDEVILVSGPTNKAVHHLATEALAKVAEAPRGSAFARVRLALSGVQEHLPDLDAEKLSSGAAPLTLHDIYANNGTRASIERLKRASKQLWEDDAAGAVNALAFVADDLVRRAPTACEPAKLHELVSRSKEQLKKRDLQGIETTLRKAQTLVMGLQQDQVEREMLGGCDILFGTLATVGNHNVRSKVKRRVRWAIVDEAAQPTEAETLLLLPWDPVKALLVGDPQQLSATVVSKLGVQCGFGRSLMGRLLEAGQPYQMLQEQYRMHPEISRFPAAHFYGGRLRDGPQATRLPQDQKLAFWDSTLHTLPPYLVANVDGAESHERTDCFNQPEADFAMAFLDIMVRSAAWHSDGNGIICLLTFYKGQVRLLQRELEKWAQRCPALASLCSENRVQVHSVDSFQGSEAEVVILSCVRTRELGFLTDNRRLNVALTRAQRRLLVLANLAGLQDAARPTTHPVPALPEMLKDASQRLLVLNSKFLRKRLSVEDPVNLWQGIARDVLQQAGGSMHWKRLKTLAARRHPFYSITTRRQQRRLFDPSRFEDYVLSYLQPDWLSHEDPMVRLPQNEVSAATTSFLVEY